MTLGSPSATVTNVPGVLEFDCPGGCGFTHPVAAGNLVYETGPLRVTPAAVILCGPCTANLVLRRSTSGSLA